MPYLKYKTPLFDPEYTGGIVRKIVDIEELWASFYDIARLINGNLGVENIKGGKISSSMLSNPRAWGSASFKFGSSWSSTGILMYPPVELAIQRVVIEGASSTFSATLASGASSVTISDRRSRGTHTAAVNVTAAADTNLTFNVTAGSCSGLSIYYTVAHQ